jgi:hypothetical protein
VVTLVAGEGRGIFSDIAWGLTPPTSA